MSKRSHRVRFAGHGASVSLTLPRTIYGPSVSSVPYSGSGRTSAATTPTRRRL